MAKLSVENVTYRYKNSETAAVKNVTCSFDEGSIYAIIGPSGSGKSTLLSMLERKHDRKTVLICERLYFFDIFSESHDFYLREKYIISHAFTVVNVYRQVPGTPD